MARWAAEAAAAEAEAEARAERRREALAETCRRVDLRRAEEAAVRRWRELELEATLWRERGRRAASRVRACGVGRRPW